MHTTRVYSSGSQTNLVSGYTYMRRSPEVDTSLPLLQSAPTCPIATHPPHSPSTLIAGKLSYFYECGTFKFASHRAHVTTRVAFFFADAFPRVTSTINVMMIVIIYWVNVCTLRGDAYFGASGKFDTNLVCVLVSFGYHLVYEWIFVWFCMCVYARD